MARNRAMAGPGGKKMGGMGMKPPAPRTAMAGRPVGGPGAGAGMGAGGLGGGPPRAPVPKPPMAPPVGAAPPMPGGSGGGPPPPGGMGGSGGFAKGGAAKRFEKGGSVKGDTKPRVKSKGSFE